MTSARPTSWSGWSNPICQLLPSLETLNLPDGFASSLARYFFIAVSSAAVSFRTAFSSCCFFVSLAAICASPSDLAPRGRTVPKSCVSLNGLEATSNPGGLIVAADSAKDLLCWGLFCKIFTLRAQPRRSLIDTSAATARKKALLRTRTAHGESRESGATSAANIVMVDVLHHLEFPVMFFREAALLTAYGYRICCGRFDTLAVLR